MRIKSTSWAGRIFVGTIGIMAMILGLSKQASADSFYCLCQGTGQATRIYVEVPDSSTEGFERCSDLNSHVEKWGKADITLNNCKDSSAPKAGSKTTIYVIGGTTRQA